MADTKIKTSNIEDSAVTHEKLHVDMDLTGKTVQVPTPTAASHPATKNYVDTEIASVTDFAYNGTSEVLTIDTADGSSFTADISGLASETYVNTAVSNLVDSAPGTLDTLNELAAALGDDANFATTVSTNLGNKVDKINITGATVGSSTQIPVITYNAQGQITSTTTTAVAGIDSVTFTNGTLTIAAGDGTNYTTDFDTRYFTETEANANFLGINAKAADADTLDGLNSTQFLRSDANDTATGQYTFTDGSGPAVSGNLGAGSIYISNSGGSNVHSALQVHTTGGLGIAVQNSGNVGIGTADPERLLTLSSDNPMIQIEATGGNGKQWSIISSDDTTGASGASGPGHFVIYDDSTSTPRFTITDVGNVGIGTSSPNPDYGSDTALEISGATSPGIVINDTGQASKYGIHADSNDLKITYGAGALATFQNDGKVGIGTSSIGGSDKLSVVGGIIRASRSIAQSGNSLDNSTFSGIVVNNSNDANGDLAGIAMYPTSQYTAAAGLFGVRESQTAAGLSFWTGSNNGSEAMRINSSGNVGIGTNNPATELDVAGTVTANQYNNDEALPTIRPSLLLDFANSKTLDPRITFTRNSNATYWDGHTTTKAEENLFVRSQEMNNSGAWSSYHSDVYPDDITAPDGTTTAERLEQEPGTTNNCQIYQTHRTVTGEPVTCSIYAKAGTRSWLGLRSYGVDNSPRYSYFDLANGVTGTRDASFSTTISSVGNGWYRCTLTLTPQISQSNNILVVTAANVDGTEVSPDDGGYIYVWGAQAEFRNQATAYTATTSSPIVKYQQVLQTAASGEARFDHNPVTGESKGLLIEEARTNLYPSSTTFTDKNVGPNSFVEATVGLDGVVDSALVLTSLSAGSSYIQVNNFSVTSGTTYTVSCWVKLIAGASSLGGGQFYSPNVDFASNTVGKSEVNFDTWTRVYATAVATSTTATNITIVGYDSQPSTRVAYFGLQVEAGSFPTSYIPTSGSTVTRSRDEPNVTDLSWLNNQEGSFSMEGATLPSLSTTGFYTWWSIEGDTSGNENRLIFYNNNRLYYQSAASTYSAAGSVPRDGTFFKVSGSFKYGDSVLAPASFDGVSAEFTGANGPTALQPDILRIGRSRNNLYPVSGHIKKLAFFTKQFSQTTLNAMTEE